MLRGIQLILVDVARNIAVSDFFPPMALVS